MIELENLSFSYLKHPVLSGISTSFRPGCFYGIFGPNGCGKSTLLKLLTGELKPALGKVSPVYSNPLDRARRIAFVEQDVPSRIPLLVRDVVALGRYPWRRDVEKSDAVDRAIATLCLVELAEKPYNHLSGGERQRVMLARAFAQDTSILLLDEPASSLDIGLQHLFYKSLRELANSGKCVVMVSHDLFTAPQYLDCVLLMHQGKIRIVGNPVDVLSRENLSDVYGGFI